MPLTAFHPVVANWFQTHFAAPSEVQRLAWPAIRSGQSTLIAAPIGSGKTLAAFLSAINDLLLQRLDGNLPDATQACVAPISERVIGGMKATFVRLRYANRTYGPGFRYP